MKKDDTQRIRRSLGFETGVLLFTQTHTAVCSQVAQQLCEASLCTMGHRSPLSDTGWEQHLSAPPCFSPEPLLTSPHNYSMGAGQLQHCMCVLVLTEHIAKGTVYN